MIRCGRVACCWLVLWLVSSGSAEEHSDKPNIVLVVADDLGYGELGCYGQTWIKTPHIDRLAAEGIRFTHFYSGSPVCAPSRCVLMTGKHTGHASIRDNGDPKHLQHLRQQFGWEFPGQNPLPPEEVTMAELLKEHGYATACIGKWGLGHVGTSGDPNQQGFDLFYGYLCQRHAHNHYPRFLWRNGQKEVLEGNDRTLSGDQYSQDLFIDEARKFIQENRPRPFLLYLPFIIPHLSIQAPPESTAAYHDTIPEAPYTHQGYLQHPTPRAGYAAMVSHMDQGVGQIMRLLDELQLDEQTIVIFTSDNGPTYGRLGGADSDFFQSSGVLRGRKGSTYEGGIRVPLIMRWPEKISAGRVTDLSAAFWDVLPTICDATGVQTPGGLDGISFLPTLRDQGRQPRHEFLYWEFPSYGGQQAVRFQNWKAIRRKMAAGNREIELYDLAADPAERINRADQHPAVVLRASKLLQAHRVDSQLFPLPTGR